MQSETAKFQRECILNDALLLLEFGVKFVIALQCLFLMNPIDCSDEGNRVHIRGFYPGSFPTGFLGYHADQVDNTLYVGFKFSALFGIFETGDFDIMIPTKRTVTQVVVKSGEHEYVVYTD